MTQGVTFQRPGVGMEVDEGVIDVKILSSAGDEVYFKTRLTTDLSKLHRAYAIKLGKNVNNIRFTYDRNLIPYGATPASLKMENNDTIDAMVEQVGG